MIPGAQFGMDPPGHNVNVVQTATGTNLTLPINGQATIEVFTGTGSAPTAPALGFQGLAVVGNNRIELVSGAISVDDTGSATGTIIADGDYQTISGGTGEQVLIAKGDFDLVQSNGDGTVKALGDYDTVGTGSGNDIVDLYGSGDVLYAGPASDTIEVHGVGDTVNLEGDQLVKLFGSGASIVEEAGLYHDTIVGFVGGSDHVQLPTDGGGISSSATVQQNHGSSDTLVTLSDGSTILFTGVGHLDDSFFN